MAAMQTLYSELEAAMEAEVTGKVLDLLVEIAEKALDQDESSFAFEILAMALNYPMRVETLDRAEALYSVLETVVCQRVIEDACEQAQRMTLEDMVAHVLRQAAA